MVSQSRAELISDDVSARVAFAFGGLSIYEYLVTFNMEVAIVWQRRKTAMSVLLLSIRWVMLLNGALAVVPPVMSSTEYVAQQVMQNALTLTGFIQVAVFSMLRVRAFTSKSYMLPGIVLILSFTPFVTNIYTMTHGVFTVVDSSYHFVTPGMTPSQHKQCVRSSFATTPQPHASCTEVSPLNLGLRAPGDKRGASVCHDEMRPDSRGRDRLGRDMVEDVPPEADGSKREHGRVDDVQQKGTLYFMCVPAWRQRLVFASG